MPTHRAVSPAHSPTLVDRVEELTELHALAKRREPVLALLYGRRRVGKTYLLDHAWRRHRHVYFLATDTTAPLNRAELLRELRPLAGTDLDPADFPSWRSVFRMLVTLASDEPLVVVLDEFQYLMGRDDDVASQLTAVWDREVRGRPLMLVLCGSEVATMERLAAGDAPLYGRFTWVARLRPFDYLDAAAMVPDRPSREAAVVYGILGGTPRFLATLRSSDALGERVADSVLAPRGEVRQQLERIVEQEKGIREPAVYRAILAAIATGRTGIDEIAQVAELASRADAVRRVGLLERLELVERERNFDSHEKSAWRHRIADPAVRFWYRFVEPNRSRLETGGAAAIWTTRVAPHLDAYMGGVFERICREALVRRHADWGLPGPAEIGRWEGTDRDRRPIEVDLVARLDDGRLLTGEIKWSSRPVGAGVHTDLVRDLEDLGRSGQGWAKDALAPNASAGHLYVSAAGFTSDFRARAADDPRIRLLTLDDLYARFAPPSSARRASVRRPATRRPRG